MGKRESVCEKLDVVDRKTNVKTKRTKKSKKNRKSDPAVNDISSLLTSSLCLVSPNCSVNTESPKTCVDDEKNNQKKKSPKSLSRTASSGSLDGFVVRTPKKSKENGEKNRLDLNNCEGKLDNDWNRNGDNVSEILLSDDEFELKENKKNTTKKQRKISHKNLKNINKNNTDNTVKDSRYKVRNGCINYENDKQITVDGANDDNDVKEICLEVDTSTPQLKKNAFQFMMDSRNKSIGMNYCGKELKVKENTLKDKEKLSARKSLLQNWADKKGGIKRKNDEMERDEVIAFKMEERSKRLKKLLKVASTSNEEHNSFINRKEVIRLDSDKTEIQADNSNNDKLKNLDNFLGMFNKKKLVENETDEENDSIVVYDSEGEKSQETLKIKMFSPQILKRRKHKSENSTTYSSDSTKTICENENEKSSSPKSSIPKSSKLKSKNSKLKRTKRDLRTFYSDNSDASNDSNDTLILRRSSRKKTSRIKIPSISENENSNDAEIIDVEEEDDKKPKKSLKCVKVAPVFLQSAPKPKIDPEVLEAKKRFLNSGIPEALKKVIEKEKMYENEFDVFPKISHVQQKTCCDKGSIDFWNLPSVNINLNSLEFSPPIIRKLQEGSVTNLNKSNIGFKLDPLERVLNALHILKRIKEANPDYPVFKCFRVLNEKAKTFEKKASKRKRRKSKDHSQQPNYEMWTEKYKVESHDDIIGNNKRVLEVKKWLEMWLEYSTNTQTKTNKKAYNSDSEFDIDSSSYDGMLGPCNAMILAGPHGCGKTMSVYVLCNELGINVIELNASSKRTGKRLLQELQEATQSHQVRKEARTNFVSAKKEVNDKKLCLLLIEDLDIVFEQDDGFLGALSQLLLTSKRPIIITTTDINCNYLQKFVSQYPIINFSALSSKILSVWLQILCLLEGLATNSDDLGRLLEMYNGDARRTLLQLQFFVQSGGSLYKSTEEDISESDNRMKSIKEEELNISLFNDNGDGDNVIHKHCIYNFVDKNCLVRDLNLEKIWWNLPVILDAECTLKKCENFTDTLGVIDIIYRKSNIFERHSSSIENQHFLKDSVELKNRYELCSGIDFIRDWADSLLNYAMDSYTETGKFGFDKPTSGQKRWLRKQKDCSEKFMELVPISCRIDKRTYALDYFPTLRAISRSETYRASVNMKRKNRFYNYLRAFDFQCSDSTNVTACNIFSITDDDES